MSSTITYKGSTLTTVNNQTRTLLTSGKWLEDNITITDVTSGGSVTITDEVNATGTTCVITSGSTPTPTPTPSGNIPLNTQLIDYAVATRNSVLNGNDGTVESGHDGSFVSDYTLIDPTMTFTYVAYQWYDLAFYDTNKSYISGTMQNTYADSVENEYVTGTLTPARIPSNTAYIRLCSYSSYDMNSSVMSLIRTA